MLAVSRLTEAEFQRSRQVWSDLLGRSSANQLFLSWEWMFTWWEVWAVDLNLELQLYFCHDENRLVGILPLYLDKDGRRIEFIGNHWRRSDTVRSEHLQVIIDNNSLNTAVVEELIQAVVSRNPWVDILFTDLNNLLPLEPLTNRNYLAVKRSYDSGVCIPTFGTFADYTERLGKNTRERLFKHRTYISKHYGKLSYHAISHDAKSKLEFLDALNQFHIERWGEPCFQGKSLEFHVSFLNRLESTESINADLSVLEIDNSVHSVLYNVSAVDYTYNLQSGFNDHFAKRVSLGTLHLGYAIEQAFKSQTKYFDLLVGAGKSEYYKSRFKGHSYDLPTYLMIRNPVKKALVTTYLKIPLGLRKHAMNAFRLFNRTY